MEQLINLQTDEVAVVGYASLLSINSLSRTLNREYDGPFYFCQLNGWKRCWNVSMPNRAFYYLENNFRVYPPKIIYLNVEPTPNTFINCSIFVLKSQELEMLNQREWIYAPELVNDFINGVTVTGGNVVMYVARPEHLISDVSTPHVAAIRASYLKLLDSTLNTTNESFYMEYKRTTDPIPQHLVINDVLDPSRPNPWVEVGNYYNPEL